MNPCCFLIVAVVSSAMWDEAASYPRAAEEKPVGHILGDNGYPEDFAGAAYMNKFAVTFRLVNNLACKRCNVTKEAEYCVDWLPHFKETCDREDTYYRSDLAQKLDTLLPCLIKNMDETTLQCLMETPMNVSTLQNGKTFGLTADVFRRARQRPMFATYALINNVACERCGTQVSELQKARDCLPKSVNLEKPECMTDEQYMLEYADNFMGVVECYHTRLGMPSSQIHCLLKANQLDPSPGYTSTPNSNSTTTSLHSGIHGLLNSRQAEGIFLHTEDLPCNTSHALYASSAEDTKRSASSRASSIQVNVLINTSVGT